MAGKSMESSVSRLSYKRKEAITMKRIILPIVLLTFSMLSPAQKEYFEEAIRRGPTPNGFYCATNPKGKSVDVDAMKRYAKSKNYIIGRVATAQNSRFGTANEIFYKFEFMLPDSKNYENYVFYYLDGNNAKSLPRMNTGRVYLGYNGAKNHYKEEWDTTFLATYENVKWTGSVVNGLIEGTGKGMLQQGDVYAYFHGTFKDGLPVSEITTRAVKPKGKGVLSKDIVADFKISREHVGALAKHADIPSCKKHLEPYYRQELPKMNNVYKKALGINKSNYSQFKERFNPENFYDNYKAVASSDVKKKCMELIDFYTVVTGLQTKPQKYYGYGLFSGVTWYQKLYDEDWAKVDDAETICKRTNATPFKAFFTSVKNDLSRVKDRIKQAAHSDHDKYVAARKQELAARQSGSSGSSSRKSSEEESSTTSNKPVKTSVNPETVSIPSYEFDSKWYIGSHDYYNVKNEVGENQYRDLKFDDGTKGKVCRVAQGGGKYYYWSDNARYETLEDAIDAVYVKQKYGKTREKGRIHGILY